MIYIGRNSLHTDETVSVLPYTTVLTVLHYNIHNTVNSIHNRQYYCRIALHYSIKGIQLTVLPYTTVK
jgi:hypothetical protein